MSAQPAVALAGVSKIYGTTRALTDVSFEVAAGEFFTLLGPSGSGKTTTLQLIAGFEQPSAGSIHINGQDTAGVPVHERNLGVVFQSYALFPHLTVLQNVCFPLRRRGVPQREAAARAQATLALTGLAGYEGRMPRELSGGEQQRVALARALVYEPGVLLLDEPLGALDRQLRQRLQTELRRLHGEVGATFICVTHDQEEALTLSDRIAVFDRGRVLQVGTAAELYDSPASLTVAEFIGESTVVREAGRATVVRPERAQLVRSADEVAPGHRSLPVRVTQASYLGHSWKYELQLPDGSDGLIRGTSRVEWLRQLPAEAVLTWHPEHSHTFQTE